MTSRDVIRPRLGVVIPTLDEEHSLPWLLRDLESLTLPHRIAVADGGSRDGTSHIALAAGTRWVSSPRGRSIQLAAGVAALPEPAWFLLLHADSRLDPSGLAEVEERIERSGSREAAVFRFELEGTGWFWRFIEFGQRRRERWTGLAYGDQGLLVSRKHLEAAGGIPPLPLMEDVALVRALRRCGRVERMQGTIRTSPRRYQREGRWRAWARNTALISLYRLGVPPVRLARHYRPHAREGAGAVAEPAAPSAPSTRDARRVLIFARAPLVGQVKTRLAADVGDVRAAQIYRELGSDTVAGVRPGTYRTEVHYTPPSERDEVETWLDPTVGARPGQALILVPQAAGDLGDRLAAAFDGALCRSDRVCVIGTDTPGVDRWALERAFAALDRHDLVIGPATDGGYWLLGLRAPAPTLFRDVPWSSAAVLTLTLERAWKLGMHVALLERRTDVDTVNDLPANPVGA